LSNQNRYTTFVTTKHKIPCMMNQESLTARELEVLKQVAKGKINKEIASDLEITEGTVKQHLNKIFDKIGVDNRVEAANAFNGVLPE
jgi:DNA-binding NarL/FixJ family response regulator